MDGPCSRVDCKCMLLDHFEHHQGALEVATEQLSNMLTATAKDISKEKASILDKTAYCLKLCSVLQNFVDTGIMEGSWQLQADVLQFEVCKVRM